MKGILLTILLKLPAQAEIISANSLQEVQAKIEDVLKTQKPKDVLVAFDIDMTLTQPDHPAAYYPALKKYSDVYKKIFEQLTLEQKDLVSTLTTQVVSQRFVEKDTPKIIKELQQKGIKTIALTSSLAGDINDFPSKMVILRRDQLQKMGVDFTQSFKDLSHVITFSHFKRYAGGHPLFYHGILSTNGEGDASKGDVLTAFLQIIGRDRESKTHQPGYYPKVILLVDDRIKHLKNLEVCLKSYDPTIQFIGVEYKGAYAYAPQDISQDAFQKFWQDLADRSLSLNSKKCIN